MENSYAFVMSGRPDESLKDYLINRKKYVPDAVAAALSELQRRGVAIAKDELEAAQKYIREKRAEIAKKEHEEAIEQARLNAPVVEEVKEEPLYYSKGAIYLFSIFFGVVVGAILLAINFYKAGKRAAILPVLGFCVLFMGIGSIVISYLQMGLFITLIFNLLGAYMLEHFFWNKYLGKTTTYRHRPIWLPLIICLVVATGAAFLLYSYFGGTLPLQ